MSRQRGRARRRNRASANSAIEELAELGIVFADPRYPLPDGARHAGSSELRVGCGPPIATAQAHRAMTDPEAP